MPLTYPAEPLLKLPRPEASAQESGRQTNTTFLLHCQYCLILNQEVLTANRRYSFTRSSSSITVATPESGSPSPLG